MTPGSIVQRGDRLFAVLAFSNGRAVTVPLSLGRGKRRAGNVGVSAGRIGPAVAICAAAAVETGAWSLTGDSISVSELAACQAAAKRANEERALDRFAPLALETFRAACPSFRSGGRRVGGAAAGA